MTVAGGPPLRGPRPFEVHPTPHRGQPFSHRVSPCSQDHAFPRAWVHTESFPKHWKRQKLCPQAVPWGQSELSVQGGKQVFLQFMFLQHARSALQSPLFVHESP